MTYAQLAYQSGFGSHLQSEAVPNALPKGQNSPKHAPHGLYAEQMNGSAFTRPRHQNLRSWLYRILPSVAHGDFQETKHHGFMQPQSQVALPNQLRWSALPHPKGAIDFVQSWQTLAFNGGPLNHQGGAIYLYGANTSMKDTYFYNADAEMLMVPYEGEMLIKTEFGWLTLTPGEIASLPRGVKFQVEVTQGPIMGYLLENYGQKLTLPDLGPIGANGLANPRDFQTPVARFEDIHGDFRLQCKFDHKLWEAKISASPLNVVAWHGNYAPYKYDLRLFNVMNTVSFDHPDPSIFTVLTSPSEVAGVANIDFVIFPERWMVAENTFRPPYYHRNIMSEYMGLIYGKYDAKNTDFMPGGGSLHNCMSAHGPDTQTFLCATKANDSPIKQKDTLAFMFESSKPWIPSQWACQSELRQREYMKCWEKLPRQFKG